MKTQAPPNAETFKRLLQSILSRPTAPFRESWVKAAIEMECDRMGLPLWEDPIGNLWTGVRSLAEARRAKTVFVAHMDHPGFVVKGFKAKRDGTLEAQAKWLGGGPKNLRKMKGHHVKVFSHFHGLLMLDGEITKATAGPRGLDEATLTVHAPFLKDEFTMAQLKQLGPWGACLWYESGALAMNGDRVRTKAADDLVGVCALMAAQAAAGKPKGVACLFSRAEESGFHGALAVLEKGWLDPRRTLMVSVETSAQLPGAVIGGGPVVRQGDRTSTFDPAFTRVLQLEAQALAGGPLGTVNRKTGFTFQRRVMDGGSCEATAFNTYGFTVTGISVPLGGYHNVGPDDGPVVEEVSFADAQRASALLAAFMKKAGRLTLGQLHALAFKPLQSDLKANYKAHKSLF